MLTTVARHARDTLQEINAFVSFGTSFAWLIGIGCVEFTGGALVTIRAASMAGLVGCAKVALLVVDDLVVV